MKTIYKANEKLNKQSHMHWKENPPTVALGNMVEDGKLKCYYMPEKQQEKC